MYAPRHDPKDYEASGQKNSCEKLPIFTKNKLDARRTSYNKPLYIIVRCKDCTIGNVLVDNDPALIVLPKHVLDEMLVYSTHMLSSIMTTRAYDGSPRVGTIEIELFIGPQVFLVTMHVMNTHLSYNILLGSP